MIDKKFSIFFIRGFGMLLRQTTHSKPVIVSIITATFVIIIITIIKGHSKLYGKHRKVKEI